MLFAIFGSGTGPAAQAYVADRTSRHDRTAGVALVSAAMGVGETLGPGVGALLAAIDLLAPMYLSAALAVLSAFVSAPLAARGAAGGARRHAARRGA